MRSAKKDRFVIDMLIKTGKVDPKRDVRTLEMHYDKVENIRSLATKGDISRDVIADEIGVDAKGGTLVGVAKNLINQEKATRKHKSVAKANLNVTARAFSSKSLGSENPVSIKGMRKAKNAEKSSRHNPALGKAGSQLGQSTRPNGVGYDSGLSDSG